MISEWSGRVARFVTIYLSLITIHDLVLRLKIRLGFGKTEHFASVLPLTTLLEQFDALETLQNVTLGGNRARPF